MIEVFVVPFSGLELRRAWLICDRSYDPADRITNDYTVITLYLAAGDQMDSLGAWDSRTDTIQAHVGFPITGSGNLDKALPEGQVLTVGVERYGLDAPSPYGFSVQPDIQFQGA